MIHIGSEYGLNLENDLYAVVVTHKNSGTTELKSVDFFSVPLNADEQYSLNETEQNGKANK